MVPFLMCTSLHGRVWESKEESYLVPDEQHHFKKDCADSSLQGIPSREVQPKSDFIAAGIHDDASFAFWKDTLQASSWVLTLLQMGYAIPFMSLPGPYRERNNKSARDNMEVVRSLMQEMVAQKVVRIVKGPSHCVSPIGLVSKLQENGSIKHRLIWDGSRHINQHLEVQHVRLSHLEKALEMTLPNDFQVVFDLSSAYYHIRIHPDHTKFLGAAFEDEFGNEIFVEYQVLPFGLASAVHAITKVFKPILAYLNGQGIRSSIFIDDGRILAQSAEAAERARQLVYDVVTKAGWAIAYQKSDGPGQASQRKRYLGFEIDTKVMNVYAPKQKLEELEQQLGVLLASPVVRIKKLASLLGKIVAMESSHAALARISTRSGFEILATHTETFGWRGQAVVTSEMRQELEFFLKFIRKGNGAPIRTKQTSIRLETILPNPVAVAHDIPNHTAGSQILVSDASGFKAYAYGLDNPERCEAQFRFTAEQCKLSSTARELLALLYTI